MADQVPGDGTTPAPDEENPPTPVEEVAATTEEAVAEIAESPWADELKAKFADPEQQKAVDQFMRETYQPYVTRLEQQTKPNRDAERLWNAFHEDPSGTFQQVAEEIYSENDPEAFDRIQAALAGTPFDASDEGGFDDEGDDEYIGLDKLAPELRDVIQEGINAKEQAEYNRIIEQVEQTITSEDTNINPQGVVPFDRDLFEREIVFAEGNIEQAMANYRGSVERAQQTFGLNVGDLSQLGNQPPAPPPTIGSTTQAGSVTPPQETDYKGDVGKAIDDMFSETPPPSVPS